MSEQLKWKIFRLTILWMKTPVFWLSWVVVVGLIVPGTIIYGPRLVPERWLIDIQKIEVTSGYEHTVFFQRRVPYTFQAHWSVDIETPSGKDICAGGSSTGHPSTYSVEESETKLFTLSKFVGAECTLEPGTYRMVVCWFIPVATFFIRSVCRETIFFHYAKKSKVQDGGQLSPAH